MTGSRSVPRCTYRLQISDEFTLYDAAARIDYFEELGVDALYVSPLLQAVRGSPHGYDVIDHGRVDAGRGGIAGLTALVTACQDHAMGLVIDIVPNHMGVEIIDQNVRWWETLREGASSEAASWFDVDWAHGAGRVLLPILSDDADLTTQLVFDGPDLLLGTSRLPVAPGTRGVGDSPLEVLARQHYAPVTLRVDADDHNYRRFFAVNTLAAIRVEDPAVFEASHEEIRRWIEEGLVTGIRVDHPDGLADPTGYLERLSELTDRCWLLVEKILEPGEALCAEWPVDGTTGYDALAEVEGLLIDPSAESVMDALYRSVTGDDLDWDEHVFAAKQHVAQTMLRADVLRLARLAPDVALAVPAIEGLLASLPVYRTYMPLGEQHLHDAATFCTQRRPDLESTVDTLLPRLADPGDEFCVRFQQLSAAVMAKGLEDTALYRYTRLIALNEVGSSPATFGVDPDTFHDAMAWRVDEAPTSMTTLSTHDTKRGEDVRARLAVLAEMPREWGDVVRRLLELEPIPNRAFAYLLWQTVVATGLIERERLHQFAEKAMREGDRGTSWEHPDRAFESAVHAAVDGAYDHDETRAVITRFANLIDGYGWSNSLAAKLVQLTMPGVPDCYQGSERYEGSLVDPDNRRPVDFDALTDSLSEMRARRPDRDDPRGRKHYLTRQALRAWRDFPELFTDYIAIESEGELAEHVVAFDRGAAITVVTRLPVALHVAGGFDDERIELPPGEFVGALDGRHWSGEVRVADLFESWPVALLLGEPK